MYNKILKLEFISMLIINLLSTFYITYTKYIKQIDYLNILLAIIFIIPIYLCFIVIFNYRDDLPLNEKINALLGPKIGYLANIIIIAIIYISLLFNFYMLIYYIKIYYLNKTPLLVIGISLVIPILLILIKGIRGIARLSFILLFLNILIYIFLLLKLIPFIKLNNIIPRINIDVSFKYTILNITNIFIFLIIPKKDIINNKKINKLIFIFLIITTILFSILIFISIGILGIKLFNFFDYPIYTLFKRIYIFKFINRLENIIFLTVINNAFINISLSFYYINKVLNKNNGKLFSYYLTFLIIITSIIIFNNKLYNFNAILFTHTSLLIIIFIISLIIGTKKIMNKSLF